MKLKAALLLAALAIAPRAHAQSAIATDNYSLTITTGNTFQSIMVADPSRRSLTIENNNTNTDNCWINIDGLAVASNTTSTSVTTRNGAVTAAQASILLSPGASYTRYYPYLPSAAIVGTCAGNGDSLYVDRQ